MYFLHHYVIDWEKVKTLEDVKLILKKINISFEPDDDIKEIEHLLVNKRKDTAQTMKFD